MEDLTGTSTSSSVTPPPPPPLSPQRPLYRFGVVETCYHQQHGQQPTGISESRFSGWIDSDEQPYGPRFMTVGEEWCSLDCGWIEQASMMVLKNDPDKGADATVEVGVVCDAGVIIPFAEIPAQFPSHSLRFCPTHLKSLRVRCLKGQTRVTIVLYPA